LVAAGGADELVAAGGADELVAAGGADEFPDRPSRQVFDSAADGQGGERHRGGDRMAQMVVDRPGLQVVPGIRNDFPKSAEVPG
jgi:hypothetical protein